MYKNSRLRNTLNIKRIHGPLTSIITVINYFYLNSISALIAFGILVLFMMGSNAEEECLSELCLIIIILEKINNLMFI